MEAEYDYNEELQQVKAELIPVIQALYFDLNNPMAIVEVLMDQADHIEAIEQTKNFAGMFAEGTYEVTKAVREVGKTTVKRVED